MLIEAADIEGDWRRPGADLESLTVGVYDSGQQLLAYGEVGLDQRVEGFVHPDHWGRGLGSALTRWSRAVARDRGLARVGQSVPDADARARALFEGAGYQRAYASWVLELPADRRIRAVPLPAGYALHTFVPGRDEQAAYRVVEDAFGEWEGRLPRSYDDWSATVLGRPGFQPWQLRLVRAPGGEVVGACLLQLGGDSGWVQQLAVEWAHRGLGLAQALLRDAFATARAHGCTRAELSTDSRTGALGLYQHVGMVVRSSFTHWATAP